MPSFHHYISFDILSIKRDTLFPFPIKQEIEQSKKQLKYPWTFCHGIMNVQFNFEILALRSWLKFFFQNIPEVLKYSTCKLWIASGAPIYVIWRTAFSWFCSLLYLHLLYLAHGKYIGKSKIPVKYLITRKSESEVLRRLWLANDNPLEPKPLLTAHDEKS